MNSKPDIIVSSTDIDRLEAMLDSLPANPAPDKIALRAELGRAQVMEPRQIPPNVVTMNSTVRFGIEAANEEFCLTLVYPKDANGDSDRISVLAPIGSALLGLSAGDAIEWSLPEGGVTKVKLIEVVYQPERAGEFHR